MAKTTRKVQRTRVKQGIWKRTGADGRDVFEIVFRDAAGRVRRRTVSGGVRAAEKALAIEVARRARGEKIAADPRLRFNDAADAWWQARVVKLRPGTHNAYGAGLKHLREHFGRWRMTDIAPTDVAAYVSAKQAAGLKGWTIKGHLTVLSSVFTYSARHLGLVGVNPVSLLDRVERPSSDDEKPKRILNADDLRALIDSVDLVGRRASKSAGKVVVQHPDAPYRLLFETAAETGGRLSEVLGLAWENIDLDAETIAFTHQLDRDGKRVPLKTKRSRRVLEVTPRLIAELRRLKLKSRRSGAHNLVFVTREGTPHDQRNVGGRVLERAVERAGLSAVKQGDTTVIAAPTFHALRHSHASALIAAGWDIEEVSARLGHADVATTMRIYVHQFDAARRSDDRRARLTGLYGGDVATVVATPEVSNARQGAAAPNDNLVDLQAKVRKAQ